MRRLLIAVTFFLIILSSVAQAESVPQGDAGTGIGQDASGVYVEAAAAGSPIEVRAGVAARPGARPSLRCRWSNILLGTDTELIPLPVSALVAGRSYLFGCETLDGTVAVPVYLRPFLPRTFDPAAEITNDALAARAVDAIAFDAPVLGTSPPRELYVNVPTYLAVSNPHGDGATAIAQPIGIDLWAHARAQLAAVTFDPGNGDEPVTCTSWGNLYDPGNPDQPPDCGYRFLHAGQFTITVTVTWDITYSTSTTPPALWGSVTRTNTFPVQVLELEAVVTA